MSRSVAMLGRERGGPTHWARRAREHDQIEIDGAEPVAEKQRAVSPEMIFDNVEKPVGARFGTVPDDVGRRGVVAGQTIRILPDHQFLLQRIRQKDQPLVELCALRRSGPRGESRVGMLIDEMEHDGRSFGNDQVTVDQGGDASIRIELEIIPGFLSVLGSIDEEEVVFDSDLFEQHVRRCVRIRRKIVKLVHREFPVRVFH